MASGNTAAKMSACDVAVVGGGLGMLHAVDALTKLGVGVTACVGNPFLEFTIASCVFVADPSQHSAWMARPDDFKVPGAAYVFDAVTAVDPISRTIAFASAPPLAYKALVVATGGRLPLLAPQPGQSLAFRQAELEAAGKAISNAKSIVINGAGTVGLEMAGDISARYPGVSITVLSRSGGILNSDPFPEKLVKEVWKHLEARGIRVLKGSAPPDASWTEPRLSPGTLPVLNCEVSELVYDVYLPMYSQRPNTHFLDDSGALNERKQLMVNESLQSTKYPEIFGVGVTDHKLLGHPVTTRISAESQTCAANAHRFLQGQPVARHVDKEQPPPMATPMNVKVGHGEGGFLMWNTDVLPGPLNVCCCQPCGGGFPFCPPPCCWCLFPGCSHACGTCCGPPGGEQASILMLKGLLPQFPKMHLFKGIDGKVKAAATSPPVPQTMG